MTSRVDLVISHVESVLGPAQAWPDPTGYPDSLALCLLDSVWSLGVRYGRVVVPVLDRYCAYRRNAGADPHRDATSDLIATFDAVGGPERFALQIGTRHRTSTHRGAPTKAAALLRAADTFRRLGVETVANLHEAIASGNAVHSAWRRIPGQTASDTGWRYLLLLGRVDDVKPDRMIVRFVSHAVSDDVTPAVAARLVIEAAQALGVPPRILDHAIWRYQSGQAAHRSRA